MSGSCALYLIGALVAGLLPGQQADIPGGDDITIHLVNGPIHYDMLLPLNTDTRARFSSYGVNAENPRAEWLVVGWGAQDFYTSTGGYGDLSTRAIWRAVSGDAAVMRLDLAGALDPTFPSRPIRLGRAQYVALMDAVEGDITSSRPLLVDGFTRTDVFLPAKGRFNLLHTCNTWIARTLRKAGVPFGYWTPTPTPYAVTLSHWRWHRS